MARTSKEGRKEGHFNKFGIMIHARDGDGEKSLFLNKVKKTRMNVYQMM